MFQVEHNPITFNHTNETSEIHNTRIHDIHVVNGTLKLFNVSLIGTGAMELIILEPGTKLWVSNVTIEDKHFRYPDQPYMVDIDNDDQVGT